LRAAAAGCITDGMIYFARAGDAVKIGWSGNPERRVRQMQTGAAHKIHLLRTLDVEPWAERWLHHHFRSHRLSGEWFSYIPEMDVIQPPEKIPVLGVYVHPGGSSKSELVAIRAPPEEVARWKAMADSVGVTLTALVLCAMRAGEKGDYSHLNAAIVDARDVLRTRKYTPGL
jgi:hypothetical protein